MTASPSAVPRSRSSAEAATSIKTSADGIATVKPVRSGWVAVEVTAQGFAPGHGFTQVAGGGAAGRLDVKLHKGICGRGPRSG